MVPTALATPPSTVWAREVTVSDGAVPFRVFEPRPRHAIELLSAAGAWPDRTAVVFGKERLTFAELFERCGSLALELRRRGVRPGDRVAILGRNSPVWLATFWAAQLIDAVPVLLNAWWTERELQHMISLAQARLVVTDMEFADRLPAGAVKWTTEEASALPPNPDVAQLAPPSANADDTAVVICTSGTTSLPKGVELSHRAVIATQLNLLATTRRIPGTYKYDPASPSPAAIVAGPLFHMGGMQLHLITWLVGGKVVLLPGRFDARKVLRTMVDEDVTTFNGVPTMMARMLDIDPSTVPPVTSLRSVGLGGAPVSHTMIERIGERFPNVRKRISNSYGMTESGGGVTSSSGSDSLDRPGTSGRAFPLAELRIDSPDTDGTGEVMVRTPSQMTGYLGAEENPIDCDGWLRTGDLGRIDQDGYLYIVGRVKDMIIRGGENIAAAVVEGAVASHASVAEVAAVALPDPEFGEVVGAVVVPRAGETLDIQALTEHARQSLAYFEVPTHWWVHDGPLPTNEPGKIDKRALIAAFPQERVHS